MENHNYPGGYVTSEYDEENHLLKIFIGGNLAIEVNVHPEENSYNTRIWEPDGTTNNLVMNFSTKMTEDYYVQGLLPVGFHMKATSKEQARDLFYDKLTEELDRKKVENLMVYGAPDNIDVEETRNLFGDDDIEY